MGFGIQPGDYYREVTPADIAPTLAALCGITLAPRDGHILAEALHRCASSRNPASMTTTRACRRWLARRNQGTPHHKLRERGRRVYVPDVIVFNAGDSQTSPTIGGIPASRIGHVHLKVANLERSIAFYSGILGLQIMQRMGDSAAFLSAGGYHHHIGLNTWESLGGDPPPPGATGLYHTAIVYPTRPALPKLSAEYCLRAKFRSKVPPTTASVKPSTSAIPTTTASNSTGIAHAISGPATVKGNLAMYTRRLDLDSLLSEPPPVSVPSTGPLDL